MHDGHNLIGAIQQFLSRLSTRNSARSIWTFLQVGDKLLDENQQLVRQLKAAPQGSTRQDVGLLAELCRETVEDGHSVLIFCGTKWVSRRMCRFMDKMIRVSCMPAVFAMVIYPLALSLVPLANFCCVYVLLWQCSAQEARAER